MKKLLLLFTIFLAIESFAQFNIGIKAGANVSNISGVDDASSLKAKGLFGFHGGLWGRVKFAGFAIQPEAMISTQGAKFEDATGNTEDWKLTYVTIPIMAQYYAGGGFYFELGPQFGFAVSNKYGDETVNDFKENLDLSIAGGLGFRPGRGFGIGVRYTAGISKLGEYEGVSSAQPDYKNGVFQASLYIPLK